MPVVANEGRHYVQKDQPEVIGRVLAAWRRRLDPG